MTTAAELAGEQGMAQALRATRVAGWKVDAQVWLADQEPGVEFTADDLVAAVGKPDEGDHRANAIGAIISSWSKRDLIAWTGHFRKSERVEGHGNLQRVWRKCSLTEAGASGSGSDSPSRSAGGSCAPASVSEHGRGGLGVSSPDAVAGARSVSPLGGSDGREGSRHPGHRAADARESDPPSGEQMSFWTRTAA